MGGDTLSINPSDKKYSDYHCYGSWCVPLQSFGKDPAISGKVNPPPLFPYHSLARRRSPQNQPDDFFATADGDARIIGGGKGLEEWGRGGGGQGICNNCNCQTNHKESFATTPKALLP